MLLVTGEGRVGDSAIHMCREGECRNFYNQLFILTIIWLKE